ncbi:MAG: polyketide synthase dehydratase domain-containing protein, partial [Planctomycetota bacterium]
SSKLYQHCDKLGLHYGPGFRGVSEARRGDHIAWVSVDVSKRDTDDALGTFAAFLDGCFHGMIVADPAFECPDGGLYLPHRIESIQWQGDFNPRNGQAVVRILRKDQYRMVADLDIYDALGSPLAQVRGFESLRVAGTGKQSDPDPLLYQLIWKPSDTVAPPTSDHATGRTWLVFEDQCGLARELESALLETGKVVRVQHGNGFKRLKSNSFIIDPESDKHFVRLLEDVGDGITDIVYLWGLDGPDNVEMSTEVLEKSLQLTTLAPMHLVQAWQAQPGLSRAQIARLTFVTRDAQPLPDVQSPISLSAAPLIGLGRVVMNECSSLKTKLVDLSGSALADLVQELVEIDDAEDEVLYHESIRYVRRFKGVIGQPMPPSLLPRQRCILQTGQSSSIEELRFVSAVSSELADDELEIEVIAAGLNFSDVMKSLGLYPGLPDGPPILGAECSGRVTRVGRGVSRFRIGQEVFGVAPGSFASHVIVNESLVAVKPACLSHQEAAAIPIAFLTADHALQTCARLRSDDRVLIHAASGGVGLAAMQLAVSVGSEIFATAG